jgi:uncharacterized protein
MRLRTALLAALVVLPLFAFTVPPNDGFVTDTAGILTSSQKTDLDQKLRAYQQQTSNEIAVLIVKTLNGEPIDDVGVQVGRAWGVGTKEKNNGILMLVDLEERQVTIQTGYGLEGAVPDIVAKGVIDTDIVPNFRQGKYFEGISTAIDSLEKHIGGEYTADRYKQGSVGDIGPFVIFVVFVLLNLLGSFFARTKSWWQGGVAGGILGVVMTLWFGWLLLLSIPVLVGLGLLFDFIVSRMPKNPNRRRFGGRWWGGGFGGGSGGGGGGFGGGSFGGGGASGRW